MSVPSKSLDQLRQDAESSVQRLSQASSRDEALEAAIKAAELSMQALKLASDPKEKKQLSSRVGKLLEDAERIKTNEDWQSVIRIVDPIQGATATRSNSRVLKQPESQRTLPTSEKILLLRVGYLNGFKFPPWTTPPEPSEFDLHDGEELFLYVFLM